MIEIYVSNYGFVYVSPAKQLTIRCEDGADVAKCSASTGETREYLLSAHQTNGQTTGLGHGYYRAFGSGRTTDFSILIGSDGVERFQLLGQTVKAGEADLSELQGFNTAA